MEGMITPREELERRTGALQVLMVDEGLDGILIIQNADLFYFAGTIQSGCLYVPVAGKPVYMVRRDAARARSESSLSEIVPFASMREVSGILAGYSLPEPKRIGMEFDVLPVSFFERYRKVFPAAEFQDATPLIRRVRMKKSAFELSRMRDAAQQVDKVNRHAAAIIREGMTDLDLAAELEYLARKEGHLGHIRMRVFNGEMLFGHTFSGADSALPAYTDTPLGGAGLHPSFGQGCGRKMIRPGEPIVVDFAGSCNGYLVDQTRIFALESLPEKILSGHEDMLAIQALMQQVAVPGKAWGDVYDACLALANKQGHADNFMGYRGSQVSFIGHGVGIEIDEYPFLARGFNEMFLEVGMVFAFEPKLVFPGIGAVGIENTFHLSEIGLEQLTFSRENIVIL
jgi:Xaa-Pro dipeptidase